MINEKSLLDGGEPLEIERKFLLSRPSEEFLKSIADAREDIIQTYLPIEDNKFRRVRKTLKEDGKDYYYYFEKLQVSDTTRIERMQEITQEEYTELLMNADPESNPIRKTRYYVKKDPLIFEIDLFDELPDYAIAEVELEDDNTVVEFPEGFDVIREVTRDKRFGNALLAKNGFDII